MINNGSCNGLLPNGAKPSHEPVLTYHQENSITLEGNLKKILQSPITKSILKLLTPNIIQISQKEANELNDIEKWTSSNVNKIDESNLWKPKLGIPLTSTF